jgi:hypothetical protein
MPNIVLATGQAVSIPDLLGAPDGQWMDLPEGQGQQARWLMPQTPPPVWGSPWVAMEAWSAPRTRVWGDFHNLATAVLLHGHGMAALSISQYAREDEFWRGLQQVCPQEALGAQERTPFRGWELDQRHWSGWTEPDPKAWRMPRGFLAVHGWDGGTERQVGLNLPSQAVLTWDHGEVQIVQHPDAAAFIAHCAAMEDWCERYGREAVPEKAYAQGKTATHALAWEA